ncbi:MAG: prolipoprotein diacylglyceryl transferase [Bacteroidetes bacterium]|nr:prolipoprotein diacylglyceryl transferase [Bacteroidota bacterium]
MSSLMLFIQWNPNPDFVSFGIYAIKWYGVLWGLSLIWTFWAQQFIWKQIGWNDEKVTLAIQYVFIGGLIGARLGHIVFYDLEYYLSHPLDILAVWKGGLASHGGLAGGILGLYLFSRNHREFPFVPLFNYCAISVPLLASLIRIGNLMNSELVGTPTHVPWAFVFKQVDDIPRHPVVLYESLAYFLLQIIMLLVFMKYKQSKTRLYPAILFIGLFGARFVLEFFKVPDGGLLFGLVSKTQMLNIPFILLGIWLLTKLTEPVIRPR